MKKVTYINTLNYVYDKEHRGAPYLIPQIEKYRNHGELCESIAKAYRGIFTENNPTTAYWEGSDIESEHASVKSSHGNLSRNYGGATTVSGAFKYYFSHTASDTFIYVELNEDTQEVIEYRMDKKEFGRFLHYFTYITRHSNGQIEIRLKHTSKKMLTWLDAQVA
jgi:hypothetical protein